MRKFTLLVVDDEADIVDTLERQFRKTYKVLKATSGIEALKLLQAEPVHVIISDQRMPEITGVQLLERAQILRPDAIRILLTGHTDIGSVIAAINKGQIYRYVTKPWDPTELEITVQKAVETFELRHELKAKNESLEKALSELKTLDQAKSHFMLLISHELKTPLTTIRSFLDLLKEEPHSDSGNKYLHRISTATDRLQSLIMDVLTLMNIETGQTKPKLAGHRLDQLIEGVLNQFQNDLVAKSLNVEKSFQKFVGTLDDSLTKTALSKLIQNAIKFSPEQKKVTIKIATSNQSARVSITNEGPVIAKEKIDKLLQPFTLDQDIMHHSQGTGLGLAIAHSLLRIQGMQLEILSENHSTTVSFLVRESV